MNSQQQDNGHFDAKTTDPPRKGSLRSNLFRSHLMIAALGVVALMTALAATLFVRANTLRLARFRAPFALGSRSAIRGLQRSLAAQRGWVLLGDPQFRLERAAAWNEEVFPAVSQMERMIREWGAVENSAAITKLSSSK